MTKVRTRFAPSPTGYLHVGGIRTALFAWLIAKQNNGEFILRIEDTDQAREVEGSADHIKESLGWLGLEWGEGPFYQSERLDIYKQCAQKLIDNGRAYADPYTSAEVQAFREQAQAEKRPFLYRHHRPENPPVWDGTQPLRFKSDPKNQTWHDLVMGDISTGEEVVDDFILIKSDGFPTYNFAHIVDDAEMNITHLIRGQEFVASMPNFLNLYEALGLDLPHFAHVPPIMNEQGNKKLSKRDGAKDIMEYREEGYLPETMINFLASLGWNDGTEQEVFSTNELIEKFSLERVQKSGARFDERRLLWLNGAHIRNLTLEQLYTLVSGDNLSPEYLQPVSDQTSGLLSDTARSRSGDKSVDTTRSYWPVSAQSYDEVYKKQVLSLIQERLKFFAELPELTQFFFEDLPVNSELISTHKQLKKYEPSQLKKLLDTSKQALENTKFDSVDNLQQTLNSLLEQTTEKPAVLFSLIRIAISQSPSSPGLADTLKVLGKDRSLNRIQSQIDTL